MQLGFVAGETNFFGKDEQRTLLIFPSLTLLSALPLKIVLL